MKLRALLSVALLAFVTTTLCAAAVVEHHENGDITVIVNGVSFTMVRVEGGTFTMGATTEQLQQARIDEKPAHRVTLSSYHIGKTEVTQALWEAVMDSVPDYRYGKKIRRNPSHFRDLPQNPVEQVSWYDCQDFIDKLNELTGLKFHLPTEAQWEFAARGGNNTRGCVYAGGNVLDDVAWYSKNASSKVNPVKGTHPVATRAPNELGLYDMSGNVWEWCHDRYSNDYYGSEEASGIDPTGPPFDGENPNNQRVCRGGCWKNFDWDCRVTFRKHWNAGMSTIFLGLRLAL